MRSINMYWKGPTDARTLNCCKRALHLGRFIFDSWHLAHPLTYSSTNLCSLGPS
jgi:hypothetical protein